MNNLRIEEMEPRFTRMQRMKNGYLLGRNRTRICANAADKKRINFLEHKNK
jgi:hypothetical protein